MSASKVASNPVARGGQTPAVSMLKVAAMVCGAVILSGAAPDAGPTPQLFAPGTVSGGANDGAPTFSPDGRTLFFDRTNSQWTGILASRRAGATWSKPELAPFSGTHTDQQPSFSPDGSYLLFVSSRLAADGSGGASHIYRVDRTRGGWSAPVELPRQVNISKRVFKPSVAANGDVYFMADVEAGVGGAPKWRLYRARAMAGGMGFSPAEPLSFSRIGDGDVDPYVAPDQSFLIFSSNTRGDLKDGHEHLFVVTREGDGWSPVRAMRYTGDDWGADDGEAQVGPDCRSLYFTSSRVMPIAKPRTRENSIEALRRMEVWDNSNANAWSLPLARYLPPGSCKAR